MKSFKLLTTCLMLGIVFLMSSCDEFEQLILKLDKQNQEDEVVAQKILFQKSYMNCAWGCQNNGWFIDNEGNVKAYNINGLGDWKSVNDGFISAEDLESNYNKAGTPLFTIAKEELNQKIKLIAEAAKGELTKPENRMADAGEMLYCAYQLDAVTGQYKQVLLSKWGDWQQTNLSEAAKELDIWLKGINDKCREAIKNNPGLPKTSSSVNEASNKFGFEMFKILNESAVNSNLLISPVSIAYALAMTNNGANGVTNEQIKLALSLTGYTDTEINTALQRLSNSLETMDEKVVMDVANSIWYRKGITINPTFIDVNKRSYDAEISALNFDDPNSVNVVNGWVAAKTHDKIPTIIQEINPDDVMYLINAIYFKGTWKYTFNAEYTENLTFNLNNGSPVVAPTMNQKAKYKYCATEYAELLEIPYSNGSYNMVILLPKRDLNVNSFINKLDQNFWNRSLKAMQEKPDVNLYLPKFKFAYGKGLVTSLKRLGMVVPFSGSADFSRISTDANLAISNVIHKTFIEVNEEGTEAAAVTAIVMESTSAGGQTNNFYFTVDRPFVFAIKEKTDNTILFLGKVENPLEN